MPLDCRKALFFPKVIMLSHRRRFIAAMAAAALARPGHADPARVEYIPYPPGVPRVGADPAYAEPAGIGDTLFLDHGGQRRQVRVYVPQGDSGPRRSILLLHGAGRTGRSMLDMWRAAADRGNVVLIAPDALDQGWSPETDPPDLLIAALNAAAGRADLAPDGVAMFGHSSGGMLAQLYANRLPGPWRSVATHGAALPADAVQAPAAASVPMRLYVGAGDHLLPPARARATTEALAAAGHPADMIAIAGHTHWYYAIGPWLAEDCLDWMAGHGLG